MEKCWKGWHKPLYCVEPWKENVRKITNPQMSQNHTKSIGSLLHCRRRQGIRSGFWPESMHVSQQMNKECLFHAKHWDKWTAAFAWIQTHRTWPFWTKRCKCCVNNLASLATQRPAQIKHDGIQSIWRMLVSFQVFLSGTAFGEPAAIIW